MKVIDASSGVFTVRPEERNGFRIYLAKHEIQCDVFGFSAAGWLEGDSGEPPQSAEDQLKLLHPEDMEKVKHLYDTWKTNE